MGNFESGYYYNGYAVVVNVCDLVELLLELRVLPVRSDALVRVIGLQEKEVAAGGRRQTKNKTYWTPPGCRGVLLTLLEITETTTSARVIREAGIEACSKGSDGGNNVMRKPYSCANHHDEL